MVPDGPHDHPAENRLRWKPEEVESIFRRYHREMLTILCRQLGNTHLAEDCFQDACLRIFQNLDSIENRGEPGLRALFNKTARNIAIDWHRRPTSRISSGAEIELLANLASQRIDDSSADEELLAKLRREVASLPSSDRDLLDLRFGRDLSFQEIATQLGIQAGTVWRRIGRILAVLRSRLSAGNPDIH